MTELDQALDAYIEDESKQIAYYNLILKTDFYIPLCDDEDATNLVDKEAVSPLVVKSEGKSYLMLFDTEERLSDWSKKPINYVILAGFKAAEISVTDLHWAVNIGGGFAKEFVPDEIDWLKKSVGEQ